METPLHILTIDLSKVDDFELIDLTSRMGETLAASYNNNCMTLELATAHAQLSAYTELINK